MTECAVDEGRVKDDDFWMGLALEEAAKARRLSPPNPAVGAVIVRDGRVIGRGFTQQTGGPHAEVMALRDAAARGESVEGATIYVTLEPCSHWGRTPPCALAIVEHRIGRVVTSVADPNPQVAGRGLKMIRDAGIEVTEGVRSKEGWLSNRGFLTRMTTGRPWVRMRRDARRPHGLSRRPIPVDHGPCGARGLSVLACGVGGGRDGHRHGARRQSEDDGEAP